MGSEEDVTFFSVEIGQVFDRMDRARTRFNFIILDACRDNPVRLELQGDERRPRADELALGHADRLRHVAGLGRRRRLRAQRHLHQAHPAEHQGARTCPSEIMFKRVREGVERETRKLQTPWDSSSLKGDFAFNPTGRGRAPAGGAPASGPSADITLQIEREFWVSVRESNRPDDIQAYLDKYPNGNFAALAKNRLDALVRPDARRDGPARRCGVRAAAAPPDAGARAARERGACRRRRPARSRRSRSRQSRPRHPCRARRRRRQPASRAAARLRPPHRPRTRQSPMAVIAAAHAGSQGRPIPAARSRRACASSRSRTARSIAARCAARPCTARASTSRRRSSTRASSTTASSRARAPTSGRTAIATRGTSPTDRPDGHGQATSSRTATPTRARCKAGVIVGRGTYTIEGRRHLRRLLRRRQAATASGVYRFASGDRYEGEMVQGKHAGQGPLLLEERGPHRRRPSSTASPRARASTTSPTATATRATSTPARSPGRARTSTRSGLKYEGEMRAGQPQGKGVFWFLDGTRFEGDVRERPRPGAGRDREARTAPAARPRSWTATRSSSIDRFLGYNHRFESGGFPWPNANVSVATPSSAAACRSRSSASSSARRKGIFKMLEAIKKN